MIKGLWFKLIAVMAGIIAVLLIAMKSMRRKNKKLKHEVKIKDKKEEIRDKQEEAIEQINKTEEEEVEEIIASPVRDYSLDDINKL